MYIILYMYCTCTFVKQNESTLVHAVTFNLTMNDFAVARQPSKAQRPECLHMQMSLLYITDFRTCAVHCTVHVLNNVL